jgi:hypothetical protein
MTCVTEFTWRSRGSLPSVGVPAAMGLTRIGTEHILLALLDDPDVAGQVLNRAERGPSIRQEPQAILADPLYRTSSTQIIP